MEIPLEKRHRFEAVKDQLTKKSNLYEFNRFAITWGTILAPAFVLNLVSDLMGGSQIYFPKAGLLPSLVSAFLLQRFLLPDRVVLWLRPFGSADPEFNIALPVYTSVVPFGRVVALARKQDRDGDSWVLVENKSKTLEAAERMIFGIRKKNVRLKTGTLLKCPDAEWQNIIKHWMRAADLVIIDATNIGPGLAGRSVICVNILTRTV